MELIFFGLLFIFLKTNIQFIEFGAMYYLTNLLGYISIFVGIKELERTHERLSKVKPLTIGMILHSLLFFILNLIDHSPFTMSLSSSLNYMIALSGLGIVLVGMFMIYYIIHVVIETLKDDQSNMITVKKLDQLNTAMTIVFIFTGIISFFDYIPMLAKILMVSLLALNIIFLGYFYYTLVRKKTRH